MLGFEFVKVRLMSLPISDSNVKKHMLSESNFFVKRNLTFDNPDVNSSKQLTINVKAFNVLAIKMQVVKI